MKHWMVIVGLVAACVAPSGFASADDVERKAVWGPLADMADHDWVAVHAGAPATIVSFRWEKPGQLLIVTGINGSGGTFKGQYELQSTTGKIQEQIWRNGKVYRSEYKPTAEGFVEEGDQDGVQVRHIYRHVSETTLVSINQSLINGAWQVTRNDGTLVLASPAWIKQLGWRDQDPSRPK